MRLCVLTNMHPAKDDRIYYKEVLSLVKQYPDVTLVAPAAGETNQDFHHAVRFIPLCKKAGKSGRLLSIVDAVSIVRKVAPDVCHFHDYDLILAVPLLRLLTSAKLVYDAHEAYPEMALRSRHIPRLFRPMAATWVDAIEKYIARLCHLIVTADDPTAETFSRRGLPVVTIFNFPPLEIFRPDPSFEAQIRDRYKGRTVVIYQGTMSEDRGLFHMIQAMEILKKEHESILLLLVGLDDEPLLSQANSLINHLGVRENVEIMAWVEHKRIGSYMRISEVGLVPWQPVPKYMKNLPIKLFEYMACGLPILAADLPPISYFIKESGAGRLYDSTNVQQLAKGVLRMLSDEKDWQRMSENGLRSVRDRWNWTKMEDRLLEAYAQLEGKHQ